MASTSTRERIVHAADRLFFASGYNTVGVSEICGAAGVRKGSFYHFFPSKAALGVAVVDYHAAALWATLDNRESAVPGPVGKIRANAEAGVEFQRYLHRRYGRVVGCPFSNLAMEAAAKEEDLSRHAAEVLGRWQRRIAGHCHDAREAGLLAQGTSPEEFAYRLVATMQGAIMFARITGSTPLEISITMRNTIDAGVKEA